MIDLTPHEQKILDLVKKTPDVIDNPEKRKFIAERNGLSEKTLRNRIADLRKYGVLTSFENQNVPIIDAEFDDIIEFHKNNIKKDPIVITILTDKSKINIDKILDYGELIELKKENIFN